jgi:hypothetical protein
LRSRESRITCQSGPLIGRDTPPARQPRAYEPIARAARGAGPGTEPNSTLAGPAGVLLTSFGAAGGCTAAAVFAGSSTGSAATGPTQIRSSNKQAVILSAISITKQAIGLEARSKTGALAPATPRTGPHRTRGSGPNRRGCRSSTRYRQRRRSCRRVSTRARASQAQALPAPRR